MHAWLARGRRPLLGFAMLLVALAAWEAWARENGSFAIPPVSAVLARGWDVWPTGDFLTGVAASMQRLAGGFVVGATVGIGLGLLMGSSRACRRALEPLVELGRATPAIAVVPVAMIAFGFGDAMQVSVIAFAVCFPILVNTIDGVRAIPSEVRDTAAMLHVNGVERVFRIHLPGALPSIAAGLRVAVSLGLIAVVISEFVGESAGIGSHIWLQYTVTDIEGLYAGLLFLGLLGFLLNRLLLVTERRLLSWHEGFVSEPAR